MFSANKLYDICIRIRILGIDHLDGIRFVIKSSLPCLTLTQKYIFDSILSIFGNNVSSNTFTMTTERACRGAYHDQKGSTKSLSLDEIALKQQNVLTQEEYLGLLIESEIMEAKPG